MPYWERREALHRTLEQYADFYTGLNFEVIVVDDGSEQEPDPPKLPFPVRVIKLGRKVMAKNPCIPINRGVDAADGDILVLTNPENLHRSPIFPQMFVQLQELGRLGYVQASCWSGEKWLTHPSGAGKGCGPLPEGFGLHFCAMLYRELFERAGGFDEDYRDGAGWEDNDFAWRLHSVQAQSVVRPDLVVENERSRVNWRGGHARNRQLFEKKWRLMLQSSS